MYVAWMVTIDAFGNLGLEIDWLVAAFFRSASCSICSIFSHPVVCTPYVYASKTISLSFIGALVRFSLMI